MELSKYECFSEGVDGLCWVEVSWGVVTSQPNTAHSHPHQAPTSTPWTFSFMWSSLVVFPSFLFFQQYPSFLYFTFFLLYRIIEPFCGLKARNSFGLHTATKPDWKCLWNDVPQSSKRLHRTATVRIWHQINAPLLLLLPGWSDVCNLQTFPWDLIPNEGNASDRLKEKKRGSLIKKPAFSMDVFWLLHAKN